MGDIKSILGMMPGVGKTRIANGCGRTIHEVNAFIKQFDEMRKMMLMMSKGQNMGNMMKQMQNMRK